MRFFIVLEPKAQLLLDHAASEAIETVDCEPTPQLVRRHWGRPAAAAGRAQISHRLRLAGQQQQSVFGEAPHHGAAPAHGPAALSLAPCRGRDNSEGQRTRPTSETDRAGQGCQPQGVTRGIPLRLRGAGRLARSLPNKSHVYFRLDTVHPETNLGTKLI